MGPLDWRHNFRLKETNRKQIDIMSAETQNRAVEIRLLYMLQSDWTASHINRVYRDQRADRRSQTGGVFVWMYVGRQMGGGQTETGWDPDQSVCFLTAGGLTADGPGPGRVFTGDTLLDV